MNAFGAVRDFFEKVTGILVIYEPGRSFVVEVEGKNGVWQAMMIVEDEWFSLESFVPVCADQGTYREVLRFLSRVESRVRTGRFFLGFRSGRVKFCTDQTLSSDIEQVVWANLTTFDWVLPSVTALVRGDMGIKESMRRLERDRKEWKSWVCSRRKSGERRGFYDALCSIAVEEAGRMQEVCRERKIA